jgi:hypothetical protein
MELYQKNNQRADEGIGVSNVNWSVKLYSFATERNTTNVVFQQIQYVPHFR